MLRVLNLFLICSLGFASEDFSTLLEKNLAKIPPGIINKITKHKKMTGGETNHVFLISDEINNQYIFTFPKEGTDSLNNSDDMSFEMASLANELKIGPKIYFHDKNSGPTLMEFLPGGNPSKELTRKPKFQMNIARKLKTLHDSPILDVGKIPTIFEIISSYTKSYLRNGNVLDGRMRKALKLMYKIRLKYGFLPQEVANCHNDLHIGNVVLNDEQEAFLIDYDYARPFDPFFDLANTINNLELPQDQEDAFIQPWNLQSYQLKKLELQKALALLWNSFWYYSQISDQVEHTAEYSKKAEVFLDRFFKYLEGKVINSN